MTAGPPKPRDAAAPAALPLARCSAQRVQARQFRWKAARALALLMLADHMPASRQGYAQVASDQSEAQAVAAVPPVWMTPSAVTSPALRGDHTLVPAADTKRKAGLYAEPEPEPELVLSPASRSSGGSAQTEVTPPRRRGHSDDDDQQAATRTTVCWRPMDASTADRCMIVLLWALAGPLQPSVWTWMLCDETDGAEGPMTAQVCGDSMTAALRWVTFGGMCLPLALLCEAVVISSSHSSTERSLPAGLVKLRRVTLTASGFVTFSVSLMGFVLVHQWADNKNWIEDDGWWIFVVLLLVVLLWGWLFSWAMFRLHLGGRQDHDKRQQGTNLERGSSIKKEKSTPVMDRATRPVLSVAFIVMLFGFQKQHFNVSAQHDVHSSLRQDLRIHIQKQDGEGDFDDIVDAPSMFRWLESDILPELSHNMSYSIPTMPPVTRTAAQCREDAAGHSHGCAVP